MCSLKFRYAMGHTLKPDAIFIKRMSKWTLKCDTITDENPITGEYKNLIQKPMIQCEMLSLRGMPRLCLPCNKDKEHPEISKQKWTTRNLHAKHEMPSNIHEK